MRIIKFGPRVNTMRATCTTCLTAVELERGDVQRRVTERNGHLEYTYDCPGCGKKMELASAEVPPAMLEPVSRDTAIKKETAK